MSKILQPMTLAIPVQLRLDNAANIYPASMSKHYSSLYRMSVTLTEPVDEALLQQALSRVSERIPTFRCTLRSGAFWWYLRRVENEPEVTPLSPLRSFAFKDYGGLLYRVSADGDRIVLDVFHALTDGNGAKTFLLTLTGEYLRLKHGIRIAYGKDVLDPDESVSIDEVEDSFKSVFSGRKGTLEKNDDAYHIRGMRLPDSGLRDMRAVVPADRVSALCKEKDCTVTELLVAAMLSALQEEHRSDPSPLKRSVLKVTVPVNLRPIYGMRTLRNFASYVNIGINVRNGYLPFDEILEQVVARKREALRRENLEPKIAANVELEEKLIVRCLPLAVKKPIIDIINLLHGDRFCSQTLSNLGRIDLPESMRPLVKEFDFVLGRQRGNSGAFTCTGYDGKLFIHMSRGIWRNSFERSFLKVLEEKLSLPAEVSTSMLA